MSISAAKRQQVIDYGVLKLDAAGVLNGFEEKPRIPTWSAWASIALIVRSSRAFLKAARMGSTILS